MKTKGKHLSPTASQSSGLLLNPQQWKRSWVVRISIVVVAMLWLAIVAANWADANEVSEGSDREGSGAIIYKNADRSIASNSNSSNSSDDEYSFSWLDPEKKIYVLQNRKYNKAGHPILSLMGGTGFSNPFRITYNLDPRVSFFFAEDWGFEVFYTLTSNTPNNTYVALQQSGTTIFPVVREINAQYGALLTWSPWYAKINVFNKILYFDWYFNAGMGSVNANLSIQSNVSTPPTLTAQNLFGIYAGTGQMFHLSQDWLVRLDFTDAIYYAPIGGTTGVNAWYSNINLGLGLGYKL